jgi:uncharacterized membrane protein
MSDGLYIFAVLCGIVLLFLAVFLLVAIRKVQEEVKKSREDQKAQAAELMKAMRELIFAVKARG